ncbi:autotransporter outer membrane beta-barrel domain-containing protein [Acidaminococcus intestini]|uniref:autotransporter outer membrane beta-barrel domain-containing protein n=1 Tax=Acidaminococcus intestini TaxID=187327 RepID=UPI00242CA5E1|nr:autotransporter outer membrane beta-barrel domain-containing protein [Acidaminococcus intestini]
MMMMYLSHKKKVLLSAAVLFALASGEAFASSYHGGTSDVTSSNETLDELYATNKAKVTVTGSGTITFTPSGTTDGEGAIDASGGSVVTIGSSSLPYDRLTANGEILAEDTSKVNLYAKEITINKGDDYAAVTATNGATITIGTANTTSLTTTGEVLSTDGDNGAASSVTLNAGDVTLNYSPNPSADSGSGGDEDHTLYADGRSSLAVNASGTVTIKGPIGAVDSGSSITVDGSTISLTHNIVGEDGVTYNYDLETRGIHVEEGASVRIGSDSTTSLAIDVENSSDDSSIVVSGGASKLELYGKTISVTAEDGIYNGKLTKETFDTEYEGGSLVIGSDSTDSLIVNGPIQTVGSDASTKLLGSSIAVQSRIYTYRGGALTIGSKSTESVYVDTLFDSVNTKTTILGNDITIGNSSYYLDGMLYSSPSIDIYDGSIVTIGDDTTATVTIGGDVGADIDVTDADLTLKGNEIVIGLNDDQHFAIYHDYGGTVTIGDENTESVVINTALLMQTTPNHQKSNLTTVTGDTVTFSGIVSTYGIESSLVVDGTTILLTRDTPILEVSPYPISALYGSAIALGSIRTESLTLAGTVASVSLGDGTDTEVSLDGSAITLQNGAVATGNGAALTIGSAGVTKTLTGDLTATDKGVVTATLSGTYTGDASATDSGNLTLTTGSLTGDLTTSDSGTLAATVSHTFTGKTTDDADTMTLALSSGATWNLTDSSTVNTLNAEGGAISLMDGTLGETLTAGSFAGDGATLYLDADGSTNTGNDHVYVMGSHTGTTDLHLESTSNTWSGALGTVLVSVGEEQGSFVSDSETEAALYYYNLELASTSDNVTDGYSTDWYLKGFTKAPTNDEGHHTTVVRNLGGITGGNYLLWRSDMDTLFRRMGEADGSLTDNTDNGIWARGKGKKFSRESDFLVDSKYNEYEVGYDWLHKKTETKEHVIGVGFAYLDGDATYVSGKGDLKGYTLGLYDTQVWKNGQYLDLSLKGSRYENEFGYTGLGRFIDGQSNSTGFSFGAEYGYKKKDEKGWFVEPQAQVVLGHFRNDAFTDSNGVHVEGESMNTALGRIGARAGYESPRVTVYAKANWYHDFGGNHVTVMSVDTDRLRVHEDYGDTWFSYGLGGAYKINDGLQAYFDLERGDGSSYDENWSWDVGLRWSF